MENKTTWEVLSKIDCSQYVEKKNGLNYLAWTTAWALAKANYPDANYKVIHYDGKPYLFDENLGYMVFTEVTINNETLCMHLPVMDGANKAQKNVDYKYTTKNGEKTVLAATMFDINTAIMRCLTKNLSLFGLGHYIYEGEDIPKDYESEADRISKAEQKLKADEEKKRIQKELETVIEKKLKDCKTEIELRDAYKSLTTELQLTFKNLVIELKKQFV